jgi:excisionase family DNA binding protein
MTKAGPNAPRRVERDGERPQVFVINRAGVAEQMSCSRCTESGMITADEAAVLQGVSTRVIYRWLEDGAIHFIETPQGQLFICLKTLVENTNNSESP